MYTFSYSKTAKFLGTNVENHNFLRSNFPYSTILNLFNLPENVKWKESLKHKILIKEISYLSFDE